MKNTSDKESEEDESFAEVTFSSIFTTQRYCLKQFSYGKENLELFLLDSGFDWDATGL